MQVNRIYEAGRSWRAPPRGPKEMRLFLIIPSQAEKELDFHQELAELRRLLEASL